jgi:hypothetical protein
MVGSKELMDRVDKLSERQKVLLFYFLQGWCWYDEHFWEGIEIRLPILEEVYNEKKSKT